MGYSPWGHKELDMTDSHSHGKEEQGSASPTASEPLDAFLVRGCHAASHLAPDNPCGAWLQPVPSTLPPGLLPFCLPTWDPSVQIRPLPSLPLSPMLLRAEQQRV